jgi:hypothetical protein
LSPNKTTATRSATPAYPISRFSKERNETNRWVAAIAVVKGRNETTPSENASRRPVGSRRY